MTSARPPLRALRAALFAAVCTALSAAGHAYTSGHDLPPTALAPALAGTAVFGWLAAARRRGPYAIGAGLLVGQGALHLLFARTQAHHPPAPAPAPAPAAGTGPHGGAPDAVPALIDPAVLTGGYGMLVAHLVAAVFCALWLARGEAAFFQLARAVGALAFAPLRLLLALAATPDDPRRRAAPRHSTATARPHAVLLDHCLVRRGPPAARSACPFGPPSTRATAPGAAV
ncbi:hypothetical protein [Streptomyces sp. NPDC048057]|uniref:hypothetical protein n=1 Tax=Streptomyces sp. NPDC048057 TaxID=3155628 RepID=UPI0033FC49CC